MNPIVLLLFTNAILLSIFALIATVIILRKEYLQVIKKLEQQEFNKQSKPTPPSE